jgi:tRNA modification GTPase
VRDSLMTALAHIEAHIDFPDEDIAPDTAAALAARLQDAIATTDRLLATAREGRLLRRGIRAAIIGRPNAGKSSLLNHLLARERAIVSPIPGTTRDTIEETANVRGLPVVFVDTAGLRDPSDTLEEEGIRRTRAAAAQAELLLHVLDGAEPLSPLDRACLDEFAGRPRVLVRNKSDLPRRLELEGLPDAVMIDVSCATGEGIDALRGAIARCVTEGLAGGEMHEVTINARHEDALRRAREATARSAEALAANASLEFVALDLRVAVQAVGEVVGKTATDDLLDVIFSQFCLGK